jgi:hypothetical protein
MSEHQLGKARESSLLAEDTESFIPKSLEQREFPKQAWLI